MVPIFVRGAYLPCRSMIAIKPLMDERRDRIYNVMSGTTINYPIGIVEKEKLKDVLERLMVG